MAGGGSVGFFGKLPGVGDFVQRRLSAGFVSTWDGHFECALDAARSALGDRWNSAWSHAPAWRFALAPGVCGGPASVGVMIASVDRVGRRFPLVLAADVTDPDVLVRYGSTWFDAVERVATGAQQQTGIKAFDAAVLALPDPLDAAGRPAHDAFDDQVDWSQGETWRFAWRRDGEDMQLATLFACCREAGDGCLWWTQGSAMMSPAILVTRGLPSPQRYADFIETGPVTNASHSNDATMLPSPNGESLVAPLTPYPRDAVSADLDDVLADLLPVVDTDATVTPESQPVPAEADRHAGHVASRNEAGMTWIAADDGLPNPARQAAREAGRMLASMAAPPDMHLVRARLAALHATMRARSDDLINPVAENAAVVIAHVDGGHLQLLRVGAASAWLWRAGQLRALFADAAPPDPSQDITQVPGDLSDVLATPHVAGSSGLGVPGELVCDQADVRVAPGDRVVFLATADVANMPMAHVAAALQGAARGQAAGPLARMAGLDVDHAHWPLAVIEVES